MNLKRMIKQYPVATFILCTLALSIMTLLIPMDNQPYESKFQMLAVLLVPIPMITALVIAYLTDGLHPFLRYILGMRVPIRWILVALGLALIARLLISLFALMLGAILAIEIGTAHIALTVMIYLFAWMEEIGWRGFALRRLLTTRTPFTAFVITGIPWSMIHVFFYLVLGETAGTILQVFVYLLALNLMITWVYVRGGYHVWLAVILHGSQTLLGILNTNVPPDLITQYTSVSYCLLAVIILVAEWRMWFAQPPVSKPMPMQEADLVRV